MGGGQRQKDCLGDSCCPMVCYDLKFPTLRTGALVPCASWVKIRWACLRSSLGFIASWSVLALKETVV